MRILDVGCGIHKQPGSIGIDRNPASRADVLADLDRLPYPFADGSFDRVTAIHVIEHVSDVIGRHGGISSSGAPRRHGARSKPPTTPISAPSATPPTRATSPASVSAISAKTTAASATIRTVRFREISVRVKLLAFWRWLGFEFLVNRFPRYRRFWEYYLCYVVRGKAMEFEFEALK